ncbi:hypothetical protein J3F83DRAFT_729909 [Trichoderma novae-zelandiae]
MLFFLFGCFFILCPCCPSPARIEPILLLLLLPHAAGLALLSFRFPFRLIRAFVDSAPLTIPGLCLLPVVMELEKVRFLHKERKS